MKGKRPDAHDAEAQGMQGMKKYKTFRETDYYLTNRKMLTTKMVVYPYSFRCKAKSRNKIFYSF